MLLFLAMVFLFVPLDSDSQRHHLYHLFDKREFSEIKSLRFQLMWKSLTNSQND
jgi:hypothetical protein